tara:strand:+ start:871 stop:1089 length:219 start_codon:yes stop_codon:yes gene_type:complete
MKVGDLIRFKQIRPELREYDNHPFRGKVGLIVGIDKSIFNGDRNRMFEVLFTGFPLTRWVHDTDCEVISEGR